MVVLIAHEVGSQSALGWAMLFPTIAVALPLAYVAHLVRTGQVSDIHVPVREERMRPFVVGLLCAGAGLTLLVAGGAPALMIATATAGWPQAAVLFAVTFKWKVSTHSAAIAALAVVAVWLLGVPGLLVVAAVPLVAWSRVRLCRHNPPQTLVGAAVGGGATIAALVGLL
jgi:membrane-associated phospholipid phosphatase